MSLILVYLENLVRLIRKPSIFILFSYHVTYFIVFVKIEVVFTEDRIRIDVLFWKLVGSEHGKIYFDLIWKHKKKRNCLIFTIEHFLDNIY